MNESRDDFIGTGVGNRIKMRLPMYEVRFTMYDCEVRARCARIWRGRSDAELESRARCWFESGGAVAADATRRQAEPAHVRGTMDDGRFEC